MTKSMSLRVMPQKNGYHAHVSVGRSLTKTRNGVIGDTATLTSGMLSSTRPGMSGPLMVKPRPLRMVVARRQAQWLRASRTRKRCVMYCSILSSPGLV